MEPGRARASRTTPWGPAGGSYFRGIAWRRAAAGVDGARRRSADGADQPEVAALLADAVAALGELTGRISGEEILGRIFAAFCVGK